MTKGGTGACEDPAFPPVGDESGPLVVDANADAGDAAGGVDEAVTSGRAEVTGPDDAAPDLPVHPAMTSASPTNNAVEPTDRTGAAPRHDNDA